MPSCKLATYINLMALSVLNRSIKTSGKHYSLIMAVVQEIGGGENSGPCDHWSQNIALNRKNVKNQHRNEIKRNKTDVIRCIDEVYPEPLGHLTQQ